MLYQISLMEWEKEKFDDTHSMKGNFLFTWDKKVFCEKRNYGINSDANASAEQLRTSFWLQQAQWMVNSHSQNTLAWNININWHK